jgi:adenosylcobinamide-GDP ribazoletransferase
LVIKNIIEIISFLTIIPVHKFFSNIDLKNIAENMYLFPLIGAIIGIIFFPIEIISFYFFDHLISGFIITSFIIILTGVHHTDALADFADGIMVKGNIEKKYKVIHDPFVGSAGVVAIIIYFIGMTVTISSYKEIDRLIISLLISEIIAKYTMVFQAYFSQSAWEGYSSHFTRKIKSKKKILISTSITIILALLIGKLNILFVIQIIITGIIGGTIIMYISKKNFGGITGDVMGATNEIVRLICLLSSLTIK